MKGFTNQFYAAARAELKFQGWIKNQTTIAAALTLADHTQAAVALRTFHSGKDDIEIKTAGFLPEPIHVCLYLIYITEQWIGVLGLIHCGHLRYYAIPYIADWSYAHRKYEPFPKVGH